MAKVESMGVHTPVALPYLIREGILPQDPKPDLYQWETYADARCGDEEELLVTKKCVAWSQGNFVRNVYRFELEGEDVDQAILADFPNDGEAKTGSNVLWTSSDGGPKTSQDRRRPFATDGSIERSRDDTGHATRALVVFLKTKAHVYFLHGASHVLDLPFEIERAIPAARGCLIQRKPTTAAASTSTPRVPAAPPNSFLSTQLTANSSYLQSPSLARSFGGSQPAKPSPLGGGNGKLDALFNDAFGTPGKSEQRDFARLYTLTNPLSDFGVVTYSLQHQRPRLPGKSKAGLTVEFETLDPAEEIIYASRKMEKDSISSLMLIVTANQDLRALTVWQAWYIEEKSLKDLLKQRADQKAAKATRRSSFLNTNLGTGATTPATRAREDHRESLAGGTLRPPGEPTAPKSRKKTRQEEEAAMASQMDPDYQPNTSQQTARESRRISSLNQDFRASQNASNASFGGHSNRRNTSFGGHNERRSYGHRKSRGSTPGSIFSRSIGPDDDFMELDRGGGFDDEENVESVVRHIRATLEAAGADNVFGGADEEFKRELVVRKLHSFPLGEGSSHSSAAPQFRVAVLRDPQTPRTSSNMKANVYVHNKHTSVLNCLSLLVKRRTLWPESSSSLQVQIPIVASENNMGKCSDIIEVVDGNLKAILIDGAGLILSPDAQEVCPLPPSASYRVYSPLDLPLRHSSKDKDVGKSRTIQQPDSSVSYAHAGKHGLYDEIDAEAVHHRRRLRLRPESPRIDALMRACEHVLPSAEAQRVRPTWCASFAWLTEHADTCAGSASSLEFIAFVAAALRPLVPLLDEKARATLNLSKVAAGKKQAQDTNAAKMSQKRQAQQICSRNSWSWMSATKTHKSSPHASRNRQDRTKDQLLVIAAMLAQDQAQRVDEQNQPHASIELATQCGMKTMLALHVYREEQKLDVLGSMQEMKQPLACVIAQLGIILGSDAWSPASSSYYSLEVEDCDCWTFLHSNTHPALDLRLMEEPSAAFEWFELALSQHGSQRFPSLSDIASLDIVTDLSKEYIREGNRLTPRLCAISHVLEDTAGLSAHPTEVIVSMERHNIDIDMLETFPAAVAAPFREAIARCEREPPTSWAPSLLQLIGRDDLLVSRSGHRRGSRHGHSDHLPPPRDVQTVAHAVDHTYHPLKTREASRNTISNLIFNEDRRLVDAVHVLRYQQPTPQIGECPKQPDWTDAHHFEQQRRVMHFVALRMLSLPSGDGMVHYQCETPLLTEKYPISGFSSVCLMQPMAHVLTIDRSGMSEEKFGWAYFHAGVAAGLRISHSAKGIDTSWIAFNKPSDLTNRHAGLLLALGLGGHLRSLAKWLSFKYLTPKHTMTSVGLLLGLSASYLGTMDGLITRMLSVHITRMLPAGAAELNVSHITQTAGLMGIGLLYYNTQHRRMSEIMLSEIEFMEVEDPDSGPDPLKDESYRLAAGFALGFINLGKGKHLRGLHGLFLPERLLAVAVGPRPVHAVHVFDRATAGAVMAIAMIYMKSGDQAVARKIDIPDTEAQYDHVRPDMLMLRAMARHIIMWHSIKTESVRPDVEDTSQTGWIQKNLPECYTGRISQIHDAHGKYPFSTSDVPFYNIATGLAWALGLKYAGSGNEQARDEIVELLDTFYMISGQSHFYDAKLARSTVRRCIDVLALSAAMVMAGTGDLVTFRRLRRLHGRTDSETPYGSHLATHMAVGVLFMGGGTYTLSTSDFAIASLMCAFYPLFPMDVHDNRVHLQAFRHFWVFAAEARCLVAEDVDSHRPVPMSILLTAKDGSTRPFKAPCLLPDLDSIQTIETNDPAYWKVTLDFVNNPNHLAEFRRSQVIHVRRCHASEAHSSAFSATMAALNDARVSDQITSAVAAIFELPGLGRPKKSDVELVLPPDVHSSMLVDGRGTVIDDRLTLQNAAGTMDKDTLWNLRLLFAWAEKVKDEGDGTFRWLGNELVPALRARIDARAREVDDGNA
ncbi:hypothetical protein D0862_04697 [Hortaea werneckii]|uniref:Anaphase-promoting complex subunit 1 N-terminal domain-containing protein n=1 Tax=Hortaea werneckii TaxID=91943 RepID=A0A3M7GYV4_HORWE|nr:hypothetical protein D0862_04697 [Hortaea werneckii]